MIFCRHSVPITFDETNFKTLKTEYKSHTKPNAKAKDIVVSSEYLKGNDNILIIDDFLASGVTVCAMLDLCKQANANVIGAGFVIEKSFENGRKAIQGWQNQNQISKFPIVSSIIVKSMGIEKDSPIEFIV